MREACTSPIRSLKRMYVGGVLRFQIRTEQTCVSEYCTLRQYSVPFKGHSIAGTVSLVR